MTEIFKMTRDQGGYNGFGLPFTSDSWSVILNANTDTTLTMPVNYPFWFLIIRPEPGALIFVNKNATAVMPSTSSFVNNQSPMNPGPMFVAGGDVIHVISPNASTYVEASFYAIQFL